MVLALDPGNVLNLPSLGGGLAKPSLVLLVEEPSECNCGCPIRVVGSPNDTVA